LYKVDKKTNLVKVKIRRDGLKMLVGVRAQVEDADHWRTTFKTHGDLFRQQRISIAHMGATDQNAVLAVFETSDLDVFMEIMQSESTVAAMSQDRIVEGSVEIFVLSDTFTP